MKYLLLCIALLVMLQPVVAQEAEIDTLSVPDISCGFYGTKTVAERNKMSPFKKAMKILLIAYLGDYEEPVSVPVIREEVVKGKYLRRYQIVQEKEITGAAIDSISNIMFNYSTVDGQNKGEPGHIACYDARHSVLFYDEKGKLIGNLEICFMCGQAYFVPDKKIMKNLYNLCPGVMQVLNDFFKQQGITYGTGDE